ncbi:MAG: serine/threonine-protein kinase [Archangium sp.]|nr:serine/threonine-protein kinase [Archangium sp.]
MSTDDESGDTVASRLATARETPAASAMGSARYQRGRELGRGGMGRVVEAVDLQFNRAVAVKELTGEGERRFALEALITGGLEHPGIASVHERGVDEQGRPWYVMRKVKGHTVAELLAEAQSMSERFKLLPVIVRTAQTLAYAHANGVIHRDVKPANIMVGAHGDVVLLDWGIARAKGLNFDSGSGSGSGDAARAAATDATAVGAVVGTPAYMSPEQAAGRTDELDERTDVFALGALLYHVLTGQRPYEGNGIDEVLVSARAGRTKPVQELEPKVPRQLAEICAKAMAKLPNDRFRNASELASALENFESDAVLQTPAAVVGNALISTVLTLTAGLAVVLAVLAGVMVPLFLETDLSNAMSAMGVVGLSLSTIEWATRGRHALAPLTLAIALSTFCLSMLIASFSIAVALPELSAPAEPVALTRMLREALGALGVGAGLCGAQLMFWGIARRRALVAAQGVARAALI